MKITFSCKAMQHDSSKLQPHPRIDEGPKLSSVYEVKRTSR